MRPTTRPPLLRRQNPAPLVAAALALAALSALAQGACTRPPAPPAERAELAPQEGTFLARALEAVPVEQPAVVVLRAERLRALRDQARRVAGMDLPLEGLSSWAGFVALEGGSNPYAFPLDLAGLRPQEPIVASFLRGARDEAASALSREADPGLWLRLQLPVQDEGKARAELERWLMGMKLQPLPADRAVWVGPGQLARLSSEPHGLVVDWLIQHPDADPKAPRPPALAWLEEATAQRAGVARDQDPAWRRLHDPDRAAAVYLDLARLPDALLRANIQGLARIAASAHAPQRGEVWARAWSLLLRDLQAMSPPDRQTEALALWLKDGPAPELHLARALTPSAQEAQRKARSGAGPVYAPAQPDPILWLQVRQDLRGWWEALGPRAWLQGQPSPADAASASLWESRDARLYHALQAPVTALLDAIEPDPAWLPRSATVLLQDADFSPQGGLTLSAALVAEYPAGELPAPLRRKVDELLADLKDTDPTGSVQVEVAATPAGTQLRVGLRHKAEALLKLDAPAPDDGRDVSLRVRLQRLRKVAAVLWPTLPPSLLEAQGLDLAARAQGPHEHLGLRLDLGAQAPLLDLDLPDGAATSPPSAPTDGAPGRACLLTLERGLADHLELWPDVPRARRAAFLRYAERAVVTPKLACASRDPAAQPSAARLEQAWGAWSLQAARDLGLPEAATRARAACERGWAWGCEAQEALALPADSAQPPELAWPQDAFPSPAAKTLLASPTQVLVRGEPPLALPEGWGTPDARGALPWFAAQVGRPAEPTDRALHVVADRDLPAPTLWALLKSAESEGWEPQLLLRGPQGEPRAARAISRPSEPLWRFVRGEHVPPAHAAWLAWGPKGLTLRAGGKLLGAWPAPDTEGARLGLAKAVHALHGKLGRAPLYHLYIEGSPRWGEVAALLPALVATAEPPKSWASHVEQVGRLSGWGEARQPQLLLQVAEPAPSPAPPSAPEDPAPLPAALTDEILGRGAPALEDCYAQRPSADPARLRLLLVVPPEGTPKHAQVTGGHPSRDEDLRACVQARALSWRFPPNTTDTYVERAWVFFPEEPKP